MRCASLTCVRCARRMGKGKRNQSVCTFADVAFDSLQWNDARRNIVLLEISSQGKCGKPSKKKNQKLNRKRPSCPRTRPLL